MNIDRIVEANITSSRENPRWRLWRGVSRNDGIGGAHSFDPAVLEAISARDRVAAVGRGRVAENHRAALASRKSRIGSGDPPGGRTFGGAHRTGGALRSSHTCARTCA